jgi:hypothetical protein
MYEESLVLGVENSTSHRPDHQPTSQPTNHPTAQPPTQVWLPSWPSIEGGDESRLLTVAATKCLTECPSVFSNQPLWQEIKGALDGRLRGEGRGLGAWAGFGVALRVVG